MRPKFKCEKCGNEFSFGEGRISLVCQVCGCYDLKFDTTILASPLLPAEVLGLSVLIEKGTPFFGSHKNGAIWEVQLPAIGPVVIEGVDLESPLPPLEEIKELEAENGIVEEEKKKDKRPTLLKAARKLRSGFGR